MLRLGIVVCVMGACSFAEGLTFTIASPVAAQDYKMKSAAFVFRLEGCSASPMVDGTAEGMVRGARRSVVLQVAATSRPGVYAVQQSWPADGDWVVSLRATCAGESAGAVIPIGPKGFIRESSKFFPRPATSAEIDASLKALSQGGNK